MNDTTLSTIYDDTVIYNHATAIYYTILTDLKSNGQLLSSIATG